MKCWFFHSWGSWHQYVERGVAIGGPLSPIKGKSYRYAELRQRRVCSVCGKMQDELICDTV